MKQSYRSYQQMVTFPVKLLPAHSSVGKKSSSSTKQEKKITRQSRKDTFSSNSMKRRTKTGCLTCRRRKKKCDENRLNGKCQACTRNFLQCCWPEVKRDSLVEKNQVVKSSLVRKKCDINSLLVTTTTTTTAATKTPIGVINPYPSPLQSPIKSTTALGINDDVGFMQLPPLYNPSYRLQTKDSNVRGAKREQGWSLGTNNKNRTTATKFVITSFNAENNLCDVSS